MNYDYLTYNEVKRLWNGCAYTNDLPSERLALRDKFLTMLNQKPSEEVLEAWFVFTPDMNHHACQLCVFSTTNRAGHIRMHHSDILFQGLELNLEELRILDQWLYMPSLTREIPNEYLPVIRRRIKNSIEFLQALVTAIENMKYSELHRVFIEDNRCKGCDKQVKSLRSHIIEHHLLDIEVESPGIPEEIHAAVVS